MTNPIRWQVARCITTANGMQIFFNSLRINFIISSSLVVLKSDYICRVKFKRIISVNLLLIVVLSSMGGGLISSQQNVGCKSTLEKSPLNTQFIANIKDSSEEFRETARVNGTSDSVSTSEIFKFINQISLLHFTVINSAQHNAYVQKQLVQRPSLKLYLDQRSLII